MKGLLFCLLFAGPALVYGLTLDYHCGDTVWIYGGSTTYTIFSRSQYYSLCKVDFDRSDYGKIKLTISGTSLDSSQCQVNVYDGNNLFSKTGGNLNYFSTFTRSVTSDNLGELYLHVTGTFCDNFGLSFTVEEVHDCDDGFYCWTVGAYAGLGIGIFVFVTFVAILSGVFYRRRRIVMVQSNPALIPAQSTVVTQSRW